MAYKIIRNNTDLESYHQSLYSRGVTTIGLDFEGEFNLHAYGESLCLIQIFDGEKEVILDPFTISPEAMKKLLEDEKIMKIMWDASSDLSLVINGYNMTIKSILDLRPAADILDFPKKDYSSVLKSVLDIETMNKTIFQRYNWMKRPVSDDAIRYALDDVVHLFPLKDALLKSLVAKGALDEYMRLNFISQNRNYLREPGKRHTKMKGFRFLKKDEQERLKQIFEVRDTHARELNWPPHRVIPNPQLIDIARTKIRPDDIRFDRSIKPARKQLILEQLSRVV